MKQQIAINVIVTILWMMLHDTWNLVTLMVGYFFSFVAIYLLRGLFPSPFYGHKLIGIVKLFFVFMGELFKSGAMVIRQITKSRLHIQPGIVRLETELRGDWEITILSCMITVTPGSTVFEVIPERGILYVHAIDVADQHRWLEDSKKTLEKAIMGVTR